MLVAASADIVITAPRTFRNLAEIENPAENLVGVASAGSEGAITAAQLAVRPVNRATEVLETVPGMVISQHSGEGKANQYYLRGFNLDHGFDFAQTIAGIPGEHADARARAGLRGLELPDSRARERRAVPQGPVLRGERRLLVGRLGQHQLLQRPRPADRDASPAVRSTTAASWAPRRPRSGAGNLLGGVRVGARQRPVGQPEQQGQVQRRGPLQPGQRAQRACRSRSWASRTTGTRPTRFRSAPSTPAQIDRFGFIEETDGGETFRYAAPSTGSARARTTRRASPPTCSATACSSSTTSPTS